MTPAPTHEDESVHHCPYCDREERTERLLSLHVGEEHWEEASKTERDRYREAYEAESEALWRFRLLAAGALVILYFGFLFAYSIVG
ncbi:MAG: DUF7410 domain-containing protein [Halanaeroarchaeum sp.]